ncbi:MAG: hypothetical protein ISS57_15240 [Anaerolineales bacterium]|nr:hypothetical protein [Chloroflexota bacterium]MBL7163952.1 hypothetical protein [Anaerolineales bacterium]
MAGANQEIPDQAALLESADNALYAAKQAGRVAATAEQRPHLGERPL